MKNISIHWFRRDLRWEDNVSLFHAISGEEKVLPLFIFDTNILDKLTDKADKRLDFIHQQIVRLSQDLATKDSSLLVKYGDPMTIWQQLVKEWEINTVYTNRDYEPYAQQRDRAIYDFLQKEGIAFKGYKDHVVFEKKEVTKKDGLPYTVFTPYSKRWKAHYAVNVPKIYGNALEIGQFYQTKTLSIPSLQDMGFEPTNADFPDAKVDLKILDTYKEKRDFPAIRGTTKISIHLRFGTISIRKLAALGKKNSESWLNELIWRDFYQMILFNFPHVVDKAFRAKYDHIPWRTSQSDFEKWCTGQTGYPMVDAGMRELNATGLMHNRVRMVVASFLTKHLLLDWRWGEAYFAQKLLDFDLASNNGGWQWASGSGCDAAPYFRVFNPTSQFTKFDKEAVYVKKWVPEYGTPKYPKPMVEHKMARQRAIDTYKAALSNWNG